jgi:hypothetical protein
MIKAKCRKCTTKNYKTGRMIRTAMNQFQKHMDLNAVVDRWKEKVTDQKTWLNFKAHFSKEIKKKRTRKGTSKEIGLANAATQEEVETN